MLVCGGRSFGLAGGSKPFEAADAERALLKRVLDTLVSGRDTVLHGAARGADTLAAEWCSGDRDIARVPCVAFPADWTAHGKAAGAIRNQRMLDDGEPHIVIAFPGGRGTADMVRRARKAGVPVLRVEP